MSKGALGLLSAYWPKGPARYPHVPLERVSKACVHDPAERDGERVALVAGPHRLSFRALSERTRAIASSLRGRAEPGSRVAIVVEDPAVLLPCAMGALEADLLIWLSPASPEAATLAAFQPDLIVTTEPIEVAGGGPPPSVVTPAELLEGGGPQSGPRPRLREPALALPHPRRGEVLHSHRTLLATAVSFGSFFLLEPGAEVALLEPPVDWLGLAAWLGAWHRSSTVYASWDVAAPEPERVDYAVVSRSGAEARFGVPGSRPWTGRIAVGLVLGIEERLSAARRRRISRRVRAPVLTVFGRNDLGPVLASHPTWFLDEAVGIPMPDVDVRPLDPADGREVAIGWDSVEEAEMGVRATLTPAGGDLVGRWLRTGWLAHVDPTGLYFLRAPVPAD